MTKQKKELVDKLYYGKDPFQGFAEKYDVDKEKDLHDLFAWNSQHEYLHDSLDKTKGSWILELGVWKGGSAIHLAKKLKEKGEGVIVCLDSWLGCQLLFNHNGVQSSLKKDFGRPEIWKSFYANVIYHDVQNYILPIHLDSISGLRLLNGKHRNGYKFYFDVVHHDATHVSPYLYNDLIEIKDLVLDDSHILVDDYIQTGAPEFDAMDFSGVIKDTNDFAKEFNYSLESKPNKARLIKNAT